MSTQLHIQWGFLVKRGPLLCTILAMCLPSCAGRAMVAGTTATRWTSNMVLCYMDARSTGPDAEPLFQWNPERFSRLLAYHDAPSDAGGGKPVDTLFDSFLFSGNSWYNGKMFWPGVGVPMNKTDWDNFLSMQLTLGAENLELAAQNISKLLPFPPASSSSSCGGGVVRPSVVLAVPYPDPRLHNFGAIVDGGRSLNFSLAADRAVAVEWWLNEAHTRWNQHNFTHVVLTGFYWFLEEIALGDDVLVPTVAKAVHTLSPSYMFVWIPYYRPGDPHTGKWKELGFDFAMLQPNYAFNNVSASKRFPAIRALVDNFTLGVELELDYNIRNPQAGGWQGNFETYIDTINSWQADEGSIMRSYYYGNIFVTYYAANHTMFDYYTKIHQFVKGVR